MISKKSHSSNILLLVVFIATCLHFCLTHTCTVTLHTHELCSTSENMIKIFDKLSSTFNVQQQNTVTFDRVVHHEPEYVLAEDRPVYPMVVINYQGKKSMYQNEVSFVEMQYWITVKCMREIPKCATWMEQPIFPISVAKPKQNQSQLALYNKLVQFVINNPMIKICYDPTIATTATTASMLQDLPGMINQLLTSLPVLMSITHNTRNQLLLHPQTTLLMYIYYPKSQAHAMWKDKFIDFIGMVRKGDQRVGYQISQQARSRIIVAIDDINKKMVRQFVEFSQIDIAQLDLPAIIAFRFSKNLETNHKQLLATVYELPTSAENTAMVLDAKFAHWLQQVALSSSNPAMTRKIFSRKDTFNQCPASPPDNRYTVTHRYPMHSLDGILENFRMLKFMQQVASNEEEAERYGKILFEQVILLYDDAVWQDKGKNQSRAFIENLVKEVLMTNQYKDLVLKAQLQFQSQKVIYLPTDQYRFKVCGDRQQPELFHTFEQLVLYLHSHKLIQNRPDQKLIQKQSKDFQTKTETETETETENESKQEQL